MLLWQINIVDVVVVAAVVNVATTTDYDAMLLDVM